MFFLLKPSLKTNHSSSKQPILCSYVFNELPKIYKLVTANKPTFLQSNIIMKNKPVKCAQCKFKSTLMQMKMRLKTVHGSRPVRASKRFKTFTPSVRELKKPKPINNMSCEATVDNDWKWLKIHLRKEKSLKGKKKSVGRGEPMEQLLLA